MAPLESLHERGRPLTLETGSGLLDGLVDLPDLPGERPTKLSLPKKASALLSRRPAKKSCR